VPIPLEPGALIELPPGAARHAQVLRLQPGSPLLLFNGQGGEWDAVVHAMHRVGVQVRVGAHHEVERELPVAVTIAFGMPANDRMDLLVEKATELGVAAIQPLVCERSVLRLAGERAERRREHWQAVAVAASEQCGRTRVPTIGPVLPLDRWLPMFATSQPPSARFVLSLDAKALPLHAVAPLHEASLCFLSGPEGGLSEAEERAAIDAGWQPLALGPRVLRADTAPLVSLAWIGARAAFRA
jgi:16S rRNA (uracil1498-N3)-methyltransferase